MSDVTNPVEREGKSDAAGIKALLSTGRDVLASVGQAALEADMTDALSAERSECLGERRG